MQAIIVILAIAVVVLLCGFVQLRLARLFGKSIGLSLSLALQVLFSGALASFAGAVLKNLFPPYQGTGSSWPAMGEAFHYQFDVVVITAAAFLLNLISALLIAVLLKPDNQKTE